MARFNLFKAKAPKDTTDPDGYHTGMARFGDRIGARLIGGSLYELPPGQSVCPYHFEYGDEEWLIVLQGRPTVRRPRGTEKLVPGDVVCFPPGPDGAHKVTNRTKETVRVLMISTRNDPSVAVYPDSDKVGARDVARGRDAYPVLTHAYASVGLTWPAGHRSTHPPTAFLLVLPVAWLPWKAASAVWTVLMLAALAGAYWALGAPPGPAVALAPLTLVWPPGGWSMGQLTPLWLLGLALAWRLRDRPAPAGAAIALASLTKLLPTLSLLPFLLLRRWSVLRGFALVWGAALAALLALDVGVIGRYVTILRTASREQAARGENSALLWAADHNYGAAGVAA